MPKVRLIRWSGCYLRLSDAARLWHLKPQTLAARIDRGVPVERALATGVCSLEEAGRRGFRAGWAARGTATGDA